MTVSRTGATGYVAGDIFATLYDAHPDYDYTLQVRNADKGALVAAKYPSVKLVYGNNNSSDMIASAAAAADIVIHAAESADNVPSATAIAAGLKAGYSESNRGTWIHISGAGELCWREGGALGRATTLRRAV